MKKSYYLSLLILTILICFAFTNNISAIISDDITETYHLKVLSKTYAFYLEQEYFCEKAIEDFPEYKSNINMPRDKFNKKFKSSDF